MDKNSRILVWDWPTRAFHWLLALSFAGAFLTAEADSYRGVHAALGHAVLALLGFRLLWGFVGTRHARFRSFAYGPRTVWAYVRSILRRSPTHYTGHNPAASWATYGLLGLAVLAAGSGYALYHGWAGRAFEELHEGLAYALLALVGIHVAGVVAGSLIHRENLPRAMVTGYKAGPAGDGIRRRHRALAAMLVAAVVALWIAGPDRLPSPWPLAQAAGAHENPHRPHRHHGDDD